MTLKLKIEPFKLGGTNHYFGPQSVEVYQFIPDGVLYRFREGNVYSLFLGERQLGPSAQILSNVTVTPKGIFHKTVNDREGAVWKDGERHYPLNTSGGEIGRLVRVGDDIVFRDKLGAYNTRLVLNNEEIARHDYVGNPQDINGKIAYRYRDILGEGEKVSCGGFISTEKLTEVGYPSRVGNNAAYVFGKKEDGKRTRAVCLSDCSGNSHILSLPKFYEHIGRIEGIKYPHFQLFDFGGMPLFLGHYLKEGKLERDLVLDGIEDPAKFWMPLLCDTTFKVEGKTLEERATNLFIDITDEEEVKPITSIRDVGTEEDHLYIHFAIKNDHEDENDNDVIVFCHGDTAKVYGPYTGTTKLEAVVNGVPIIKLTNELGRSLLVDGKETRKFGDIQLAQDENGGVCFVGIDRSRHFYKMTLVEK